MKTKCWKLKNACDVPVRSHSPQKASFWWTISGRSICKSYLPDAELGQTPRPVLASQTSKNVELDLVRLLSQYLLLKQQALHLETLMRHDGEILYCPSYSECRRWSLKPKGSKEPLGVGVSSPFGWFLHVSRLSRRGAMAGLVLLPPSPPHDQLRKSARQ